MQNHPLRNPALCINADTVNRPYARPPGLIAESPEASIVTIISTQFLRANLLFVVLVEMADILNSPQIFKNRNKSFWANEYTVVRSVYLPARNCSAFWMSLPIFLVDTSWTYCTV